jgi:hypothetical protein
LQQKQVKHKFWVNHQVRRRLPVILQQLGLSNLNCFLFYAFYII